MNIGIPEDCACEDSVEIKGKFAPFTWATAMKTERPDFCDPPRHVVTCQLLATAVFGKCACRPPWFPRERI